MALGLGIGVPFFTRIEDCRWNPSTMKTMSSTSCSYSPHLHPAPDTVQPTRTIAQRFSLELRLWFIAGAAEVR